MLAPFMGVQIKAFLIIEKLLKSKYKKNDFEVRKEAQLPLVTRRVTAKTRYLEPRILSLH